MQQIDKRFIKSRLPVKSSIHFLLSLPIRLLYIDATQNLPGHEKELFSAKMANERLQAHLIGSIEEEVPQPRGRRVRNPGDDYTKRCNLKRDGPNRGDGECEKSEDGSVPTRN